jgi:antitoxin component YwqK of YwqJK toxin-antitoxin module
MLKFNYTPFLIFFILACNTRNSSLEIIKEKKDSALIENPNEEDLSSELVLGIYSIGDSLNGKRDGKWTDYYKNGQIAREVYYKNGLIDGLVTWYYDNKIVALKSSYIEGKRNGIWKSYSQEGKLTELTNYKDGHPFGEWEKYHPNGKILYFGKYDDIGNLSQWKEYNDKGKLISTGYYNEFKKSGEWTYFHENGNILSHGQIKGELEYAEENIYIDLHLMPYPDTYGDYLPFIPETTLFVKGGEWKEFDENCNLKASGKYKNDKKIGLWSYFNTKGELIKKEEIKTE